MKRILFILLIVLTPVTGFTQVTLPTGNREVKWITIDEAEKQFNKSPRPFFIDTYTDWCGWCKKMDKETFTNPVIAEILNNKFYPVKFDAEGTESVTFRGQTFVNDGKAGKAHQLAVALLQGQLSYPTVVFMLQKEGKFEVAPVPGFREAKEMEILLNFFADQAYKTQNFDDFRKNFIGKVQ
jgi:thioredoxin-related protein